MADNAASVTVTDTMREIAENVTRTTESLMKTIENDTIICVTEQIMNTIGNLTNISLIGENVDDNVTNKFVSFSFRSGVIISSVTFWGIISNIFILFVLLKSKMAEGISGKCIANEAIADLFLVLTIFITYVIGKINKSQHIISSSPISSMVGSGFSSVKGLTLMGHSIILSIAICDPIMYRVYVQAKRVKIYLATIWLIVPIILGYSVLEGTFYEMEEHTGMIRPNYNVHNWWVGALTNAVIVIIPFTVTLFSVVKISFHRTEEILKEIRGSRGSESKIRLAMLNLIIVVLHILAQLPLHITRSLHNTNTVISTIAMLLYFLYPSLKCLIYLTLLHTFRRTVCMCLCCATRTGKRSSSVNSGRLTSQFSVKSGRRLSSQSSVRSGKSGTVDCEKPDLQKQVYVIKCEEPNP